MRKLMIVCLGLALWACNTDKGPDCFKKAGSEMSMMILTDEFDRIHISDGIELVVQQTDEQSVKLTYGKNLIDAIRFEVIDGELKITNENGCQLLRNYHPAQVYITTPILTKIYSGSQYSIHSDGLWTYPNLTLESGIVKDTPSSVFEIEIDNQRLMINDNISSVFKIRGKTEQLSVSFWGANGRLEAENLLADEILVYHRSTNDMIVHPIHKISGTLLSTGNLVLKNVPEIVEVEELFTGKVVYP